MKKIIIGTFGLLALSSFVFASDDMVMCTMDYNPVCGVDGKTYGNACGAGAAKVEIAYKGECNVDNVSLVDEKTKNIIDTNVNNLFNKRDDIYLFTRLSNYVKKTLDEQKALLAVILQTPEQSQKFQKYLSSLEYLNDVISSKIIEKVDLKLTKYIQSNLTGIVLNKEVLGGKFYTTDMSFLDQKISIDNKVVGKVTIVYEDGHNSFTDDFNFEYLKDKITLKSLGENITIKKDQKITLSDGSMLSIKNFINSPCPTGASCLWAGQMVNFELTKDSKISEFGIQPSGSYEIGKYKFSLTSSDYESFAKLKLISN